MPWHAAAFAYFEPLFTAPIHTLQERSRLVTKANFFSFVPPEKRPWMEHVFMPWHATAFSATPLLPPRTDENGSGLFH